jgi:membrane-associated phospholipid phosphatase
MPPAVSARPKAWAGRALLVALAIAGGAGAVRAQSAAAPQGPGPAALALGKQDYYWISAAVLAAIPAQILYFGMSSADTSALDKHRDLWAFDRWTAGMYSSKLSLASDLAIAPLLVLPLAATAWDSREGRQTWGAAFSDAVIYGEALSLSSSLDLIVRSLRVHPRPLVYGSNVPAKDRLAGEASGSFYSGHANAAFLSAVYFSYTYSLRHPDSRYQGWLWAGSLGAATMVAGLRVAAGKHYLSDVVVGAAVGSLFGWGLPYLHRRKTSGGGGEMGLGINQTGVYDGYGAYSIYPVLTWRF